MDNQEKIVGNYGNILKPIKLLSLFRIKSRMPFTLFIMIMKMMRVDFFPIL